VRDFAFVQQSNSILPKRSRLTYAIGAALPVLVLVVLFRAHAQPMRLSSAGSPSGNITAYVSGSVGGSTAAPAKPVQPKKPALTTPKVTKAAPQEVQSEETQSASDAVAGTAGVAGAGQGPPGPVRLGTGGNLTLLKKVQPVYPPLMQRSRLEGAVVLDAIIHPDGTIGEITVVRATNDAFAQSAIAAVKQWRYSPLGFEGLLTVNVNFALQG
jgi:TonB family protein